MKTIKLLGFPILLIALLIMSSIPFQSCDPEDDGDIDTCSLVYKPNIYIYPTEKMQININLNFPIGGNIILSIPEYGNGWNIIVDTNGLIDNTYNYLFYESKQPDIWQLNEGWIIKKSDVKNFFIVNMSDYGFFDQEINDFIDYWIPRLTDNEFYAIYPQSSIVIGNVIELNFSKEPENLLRLFYVIQGFNDFPSNKLIEPQNDELFKREGFFMVEWGVVLK